MAVKIFATAMMMMAIALIPMAEVEGQTSCVMKLVPCAGALTSTGRPSKDCCDAIKETVEKETSCLCTIYNTPGLLSQFNVSANLALNISRRCDVDASFSTCSASVTPPPQASLPPPARSNGTEGNDNGAGHKLAGYGVTTIILSFVSTIFF